VQDRVVVVFIVVLTPTDRSSAGNNLSLIMAHPNHPQQPDLSKRLPPLIPRRRQANTTPADPSPETPALPEPTPLDLVRFKVPCRRILLPQDLDLFLKSPSYTLIIAFVFGISDSVRKTPISVVSFDSSPCVKTILTILDEIEAVLKSNPPLDTGSRFGNPAFRSFGQDVASKLEGWHQKLGVPSGAGREISTYLGHSFGSLSRIDYGSGHELNFFLWLLCLNRLDLLPQSTFPSLALAVFHRYLRLIRKVQSAYYLEPAGSHGVWGLDDYQFLPFLFGASQLVDHPFITPKGIHNQATLEDYSKDFLYLDQVSFVSSVKNVNGLRWHSPMLDDISSAKSWDKIETGMKKMFVKEVLSKLPVMQHFLFGSLIPAADGMSDASDEEAPDHDHAYSQSSWGDCCGIKVPSSLGAAGEMKKRMGDDTLRRIPFD
jgi:serine/threonine-protein phosphatase 2A activator